MQNNAPADEANSLFRHEFAGRIAAGREGAQLAPLLSRAATTTIATRFPARATGTTSTTNATTTATAAAKAAEVASAEPAAAAATATATATATTARTRVAAA